MFVILAPLLAPCGAAATPDPATIAQDFYKALNRGNIEAAMALVAEDVECRTGCYITGKESFGSYIQAGIDRGDQIELTDLKVDGDKVTYNWEVYSKAGSFLARGVETLQINDGLIILFDTLPQ